MIYSIKKTSQFKQDFKQCIKRGFDINKLLKVLTLLQNGVVIPISYLDHQLQPPKFYIGCRELHIEPNWLLIYKYSNNDLILYLVRTGTHSDLFR